MTTIALTRHAILQYRDRVKPLLGMSQARAELKRLTQEAPEPTTDPPFRVEAHHLQRTHAWLEVCPGVVLPLVMDGADLLAVTCLIQGGITPSKRRAARRERRKAQRARRTRKNFERSNHSRRRRADA